MRLVAVGPTAGMMIETDKPDGSGADNWYMDIMHALPMDRIQSLWIEHCVSPWLGNIRHLLTSMTELKEVACLMSYTSVSVLNALRTRDGEPPICPKLSKMRLQIGSGATVLDEKLTSFLKYRARIGCRISALIMESYHYIGEMEGLHALVDDVEYRTSLQWLSQMDLPEVCTTKWHAYWRDWEGAWDT
ncbi:hypothetical protein CERSUDRAFT_88413 [Gelatoporia subvermispora B]|uniref:Uncharacterized protein n=1 Tax=Ceriporiopsis subvermispora (strain B) TaxID=914234 RepID=M2Q5P0_CERS8|nr:hypothetical protein CERSUDRAFT_88413 [Gelatoporia subvermispora B]